jgi:hypothetical protein
MNNIFAELVKRNGGYCLHWLIKLYSPDEAIVMRFVNNNADVEYDGETYTAGAFNYKPNNAESGYNGGGSLDISYIGNQVIDLIESYKQIRLDVVAILNERGEITPYHRYQHTYGSLQASRGKAKFSFAKDDRLEMTFPALIWNASNNRGNA